MKATVDRIEWKVAVLISREDPSQRITLPAMLLPPGCREGDIVSLTLETDADETEAARTRVASIVNRLVSRQRDK
jgi:hypothetical protein